MGISNDNTNKAKGSKLAKAEESLNAYNLRVDECDGAALAHAGLRHIIEYLKELEARVKELEARPVNSGGPHFRD